MTERWRDYFTREKGKCRGLLEFAARHWAYHRPLYAEIERTLPPPARLLDAGCGGGLSDIYLQECGYEVTGVDSDEALVEEARENARRLGSAASFKRADAAGLGEFHGGFDLAFSAGVLEHFDRGEAVAMIREQARCAPRVLVVIPTRFTKYAGTITDERIYRMRQLRGMIEEAGLRVLRSFGYGDVTSPFHNAVRRILPRGILLLLQRRFSYAMQIGCMGERTE